MKIFRFVCLEPIQRHGRHLPAGSEFHVKKSSSRVHVDRWLEQGRIKEITAGTGPNIITMKTPNGTTGAKKTAVAKTAKEASVALDDLMQSAIQAAGVADIGAFRRLPKEEKDAFLAQARGQRNTSRSQLRAMAAETEVAGVRDLDPETVMRSPFNREIDEEDPAWREFVADVAANGVLQNGIVRPAKNPPSPKILWEVIAGEGRWEAAKRTNRVFPAIVQDVGDTRAIELQAIENMKRRGLNAIDEAIKYQQLMERYEGEGLTKLEAVARIEEKTGKSESTIYERLSLLTLPEAALKLVRRRRIPASHAGLLTKMTTPARIDRVALQIADNPGGVLSFREAKILVDREVKFEGYQAEWERMKAMYEANGWPVLSQAENERLLECNPDNDWWRVKGHDYVKADESCQLPGANYRNYNKLWRKEPTATLGQLEHGRPVKIFAKTLADEAVKRGGRLATISGRASSRPSSEIEAERKTKARRSEFVSVVAATVKHIECDADSATFWRFFARSLVRQWRSDPIKLVSKRRAWAKGMQAQDDMLSRIEKMGVHELRGLCSEILLFGSWPSTWSSSWGETIQSAAEMAGQKLGPWDEKKSQTSGKD